jgi:hypothetical protein
MSHYRASGTTTIEDRGTMSHHGTPAAAARIGGVSGASHEAAPVARMRPDDRVHGQDRDLRWVTDDA